MAEDKQTYNALDDKPTNWQVFEDDNNTTDASDSSSDVANDASEQLDKTLQSLESDASIAALSSIVGAVIYESWQNKDGASKDSNMFSAIASIIEESQSKSDSQSKLADNSDKVYIVDLADSAKVFFAELLDAQLSDKGTMQDKQVRSYADLISALGSFDKEKRNNLKAGLKAFDTITTKLEKLAPRFNKMLASAVDGIVASAEKLASADAKIKKFAELADTFKSFTTGFNDMAVGVMKFAGGIAMLGLAIWAFGQVVTLESIGLMLAGAVAVAGVIALLGFVGKKFGNSKMGVGADMLMLASATAVFVLAVVMGGEALKENWESVLIVLGVMTALVMINTLASRLAGGKGGMTGGQMLGIAALSASVAILALAIWGWNQLITDEDMWWQPVLAIAALTFALAGAVRLSGGGKDIILGATAVAIASASIAVLALAMLPWNTVEWAAMGKAGLAFTVVTAGVSVLGHFGAKAILGATSLIIAAAGVAALAFALTMIQGVDGDSMLQFGLFVGAIGLATIGLGALSGMSILGATALIMTGAAALLYATALDKIRGSKVDDLVAFGAAIVGIAGIATVLGNPITVLFTLAGAAALGAVGLAVLQFAKTMKIVTELNLSPKEIQDSGKSLGLFIEALIETFDEQEDKLDNAKKGINAVKNLGGLVYTLAEGLKGMATLVFPKYEEKDGKLVITGTIDMNEQLPKIGENLGELIKALTGPLTDVGKTDNKLFRKSDVEKGINALKNIGNIITPLTDIVKVFSEQKITKDYLDTHFKPAITSLFDTLSAVTSSVKNIDTKGVDDKAESISALLNAITENKDIKSTAETIEQTSVGLVKLQDTINKLDLQKLTKFNLRLQDMHAKDTADAIKNLAANIEGPLRKALETLFKKLEDALNDINELAETREQPRLGMSSDAGPAFSFAGASGGSALLAPRINTRAKTDSSTGLVNVADKYEDFADNDDTPVMSLLLDIYDLLETGILVRT